MISSVWPVVICCPHVLVMGTAFTFPLTLNSPHCYITFIWFLGRLLCNTVGLPLCMPVSFFLSFLTDIQLHRAYLDVDVIWQNNLVAGLE